MNRPDLSFLFKFEERGNGVAWISFSNESHIDSLKGLPIYHQQLTPLPLSLSLTHLPYSLTPAIARKKERKKEECKGAREFGTPSAPILLSFNPSNPIAVRKGHPSIHPCFNNE